MAHLFAYFLNWTGGVVRDLLDRASAWTIFLRQQPRGASARGARSNLRTNHWTIAEPARTLSCPRPWLWPSKNRRRSHLRRHAKSRERYIAFFVASAQATEVEVALRPFLPKDRKTTFSCQVRTPSIHVRSMCKFSLQAMREQNFRVNLCQPARKDVAEAKRRSLEVGQLRLWTKAPSDLPW